MEIEAEAETGLEEGNFQNLWDRFAVYDEALLLQTAERLSFYLRLLLLEALRQLQAKLGKRGFQLSLEMCKFPYVTIRLRSEWPAQCYVHGSGLPDGEITREP